MITTLRKARPDDAEQACDVLRRSITECCNEDHHGDAAILAAWLGNKTPENVQSWFESSRGYAVVAEQGEMIVGTGMLSGDGVILLCYVVPEVRFTGVGKAMLKALEAEARRRGLSKIELSSSITAFNFYKRNGYFETGEEESIFGLTAKVMRKSLEFIRAPRRGGAEIG